MNATTNRQIQKAGDNASQIQAQTVIQNIGISEERVHDIVGAACDRAIESCLMESRNAVEQRLGSFKDELYVIVGNQLQLFESLREPSCAATLGAAAGAAARTNSAADHQMLAELLVKRFESPSDCRVATGVTKAIEIVEFLTDEELAGLTVFYAVNGYTPSSGVIGEGIKALAGIYEKLPLDLLPAGTDWMGDLDILDAIRYTSVTSLTPFLDLQFDILQGYTICGVKADSTEEAEVLEKLEEVGLPTDLLVNHELNPGYKRLSLRYIDRFDNLSHWYDRDAFIPGTSLNNAQIESLRSVCQLSQDGSCAAIIRENLKKEMFKLPVLVKVHDWWNSIPWAPRLTPAGECLASANARRLNSSLPE